MEGTTGIVKGLLLLAFIGIGVNGEDGLTFKKRSYDISFPCEKEVCFYMWQISKSKVSEYVAVVSNGEIQKDVSEAKTCTFQIKDVTEEDVGYHHCQQGPTVSSPHTPLGAPELNLVPSKTATLQCVFLTYVERGHCYTQQQQQVSLAWVDEVGAVLEEDSQHLIKQQSSCDITLTVSLQRAEKKKFRCQATVAEQVKTSLEMTVGASAIKPKGKTFITEPARQGGSHYMIGGAVGVVGCVVLTAVVAVFIVNKRRTNSQLPDGHCSVQSNTANVVNTGDIIYADVILPVGSDKVWVHEREPTEYACVQYK